MVLSPIDYVIIALYFIVIVAIGFIAARFANCLLYTSDAADE